MIEKSRDNLRNLVVYFLRLCTTGFGGPAALVGYMHRDLVEDHRWIEEKDYREGLAFAQLAPGPLAAQLAIYLGYVERGIVGATLTGFAFILPSFLMVLALAFFYSRFEGLPWIRSVFYGVGPGVIGIIIFSTYTLARKSLEKDWLRWLLFAVVGIVTALTGQELVWLIIGAGLLFCVFRSPPFQSKTLNSPPDITLLLKLLWFFTKAGAFVFGSGLAIVPFLYGGTVKEYHWLSEQQFVDAVAVAMITPGPVVITVAFIGYLTAGFPGALAAATGTFLPCYLLTIVFAPYVRKKGQKPIVKLFVTGVTAAAIGAIAGAVFVLGRRTISDPPAIVIMIVVLAARFRKIPEIGLIGLCAAIGLVMQWPF